MVLPDLNFTPPAQEEDDVNMQDEQHEDEVEAQVLNLHEDEQHEDEVEEQVLNLKEKRRSLTDEKRYASYMAMCALSMQKGGDLKEKDKQDVAALFEMDIQVIWSIWRKAKKQIALGQEVNVLSNRKGSCGRKAIIAFYHKSPRFH